jgi:two-component system alkaline phosphatase synthesis response regulator PhoP
MADNSGESHPRILIVEDDPAIGAFVQTALEREGFVSELVKRGDTALERAETFSPDLILLDLMLPGLDGLQVCQALRHRAQYTPIIMLTAKDEEVDKIVGFELGADDYITKPFKIRELLARVRALLRLVRRSASPGSRVFRFGSLEINTEGRTVNRDGQPVNLTPKEFELLALLVSHPRRVFGRETLLEKVWGYDYAGETRTVDVHIQRLRQKIETNPREPRFLLTVRNIGYKFEAPG